MAQIRGGDIVFTALVDFARAVQQVNRLERVLVKMVNRVNRQMIESTRSATDSLTQVLDATRAVRERETAWVRPSIWEAQTEDIHKYFVVANRVLRELSAIQMGFFALQMTGISIVSMFDDMFNSFVVGAVKARDSLRLMENSFKLLGAGASSFEEVKELARDTRYELTEVAGIARVLLSLGLPADKVAESLEPLLSYATALDLTADTVVRIGYALSQIYNSARVNAQDVRQLTNAFVPVHDIVAEQLGIAATEVDEAIRRMDPRELFDVIIRGMADRTRGVLQQTRNDFATVIGALRDSWQQFLAEIAESPTFTIINRAIRWLADSLESLTNSLDKGAGATNWFTRAIANLLGSLTILGSLLGRVLIGLGILGGAAYGMSMGWQYLGATLFAVAVSLRNMLMWLGRVATVQAMTAAVTRFYHVLKGLPATIRATIAAMRTMQNVALTLRGALVAIVATVAIWKISEAFSYVTKSKRDVDELKESVRQLGEELEDLKRRKAGPEEIKDYIERLQRELEKAESGFAKMDFDKEYKKATSGLVKGAAVAAGVALVAELVAALFPPAAPIAGLVGLVAGGIGAALGGAAVVQGARTTKQFEEAVTAREKHVDRLRKQLEEAKKLYNQSMAEVRKTSQETAETWAAYELAALHAAEVGDRVAQVTNSAYAELLRTLEELNEAQERGEDVTKRVELAWEKYRQTVRNATRDAAQAAAETEATTRHLQAQLAAIQAQLAGRPFEARQLRILADYEKAVADIEREYTYLPPAEQERREQEFRTRIALAAAERDQALAELAREKRNMMVEEQVAGIRAQAYMYEAYGDEVQAELLRAQAAYVEDIARLTDLAEEGYDVTNRMRESEAKYFAEVRRINAEGEIRKLADQLAALRFQTEPFAQVKTLFTEVIPKALKRLFGVTGEQRWREYEITSRYAELLQAAKLWGGGIVPPGFEALLKYLEAQELAELEQRRYTVTTTDIVGLWSRAVMRSLEMAAPEQQMIDISAQQLDELRTTSGTLMQILRKIDEFLAHAKTRETQLSRTMESIELSQKGLVANAW